MPNHNDLLNNFNTVTNIYQRSLLLEYEFDKRKAFPTGIVPYLQKLETEGYIASPYNESPPDAPELTTSFQAKLPLSEYKSQDYVLDTKYMTYLGKMDGYPFNQSIPKFDPWFRDILKKISPEYNTYLETTFQRDPSTPERVTKHIGLFDRQYRSKPNGAKMKKAEEILSKMFHSVGHIEPIDLTYDNWANQIIPQFDMTSSPGLPLRREYKTQGECLGLIYDKAKRLNHFAKFLAPYKVRAPPCMIGLRPGLIQRDELDSKIKARGVWAYPAEVKVIESRFTIPLLQRFSTLFGKIPYPTGVNLTKQLPCIIDHLLDNRKFGLITDISKLDTCVGPDWINYAFNFLKKFYFMGMTESAHRRNENTFEFLRYYFINTLILLPSGQLLRKRGGVPSGSGFTQIVDTIVTLLSAIYTLVCMGVSEDDILGHTFAVGDDFATSVAPDFDLKQFVRRMNAIGFEINESKVMFSNRSKELKFLGYSKIGGHVFRDTEEFLKAAYFPEKYVGSSDRSKSRLLAQFLAGGMSDPAFGAMVGLFFEQEMYKPIPETEIFLPQKRWMKHALGIDSPVTSFASAIDYFHLV